MQVWHTGFVEGVRNTRTKQLHKTDAH
uniref:Uncharacterized protein n=1 Tax=Arundo donax TaxID=35708 RepID=A0A0A9GZV9_ARUDO